MSSGEKERGNWNNCYIDELAAIKSNDAARWFPNNIFHRCQLGFRVSCVSIFELFKPIPLFICPHYYVIIRTENNGSKVNKIEIFE